jgi:hypothetical protein
MPPGMHKLPTQLTFCGLTSQDVLKHTQLANNGAAKPMGVPATVRKKAADEKALPLRGV